MLLCNEGKDRTQLRWLGYNVVAFKRCMRVKLTFKTACLLLTAYKLWMLRDCATSVPVFHTKQYKVNFSKQHVSGKTGTRKGV